MNARDKMVVWRDKRKASYESIAQKCGISIALLKMIEEGAVTHPLIVERIQKVYGLTDSEAEELLPINRQPNNPEYNPDKYVVLIDPRAMKVMPKQSVVEQYVTEANTDRIIREARKNTYG